MPEELRPRLGRLVAVMAAQIGQDSAKLEDEAMASLDGIKAPPEPAMATAKWAELIAGWRKNLFPQPVSSDILETIDAALAKARLGAREK